MKFLHAPTGPRLMLVFLLWSFAGVAEESGTGETIESVAVPEQVELRRTDGAGGPDVGIVLFDPGVQDSLADESVHPAVREAEARFLPVLLRRQMVASGYWGVVRIVPDQGYAVPMLVTGRIERSDGVVLRLTLTLTDAAGDILLQRRYEDRAGEGDYAEDTAAEPFMDLYRLAANDMSRVLEAMPAERFETLVSLSQLAFAQRLAPGIYSEYTTVGEDGRRQLLRLPSPRDEMWRRVLRLQRQEHLFIDTADEQYRVLMEEFAPTYQLWRRYNRELLLHQESYRERVGQRENGARRGTFSAMQQSYGAFRAAKLQEQDLLELAEGFESEVTDTMLDIDDRVVRLRGSLREQYDEWHRILEEIFRLETSMAAP